MQNMICNQCRYWHRMDTFKHISKGEVERGSCSRFDYSAIELPPDEMALPPRSESSGHGAAGTSGKIITGPLFGCVNFEQK